MHTHALTRKELTDEIRIVTERVAELVTLTPDTSRKVKNSEWTIGEMAAHLVVTKQVFRSVLHGAKSPYPGKTREIIAEKNADFLKEYTIRDGNKLAELLLKRVNAFLRDTDKYPDGHTFSTHYGVLTLPEGLAYCLCHLLMHGSAIALTLNKPFPISGKDIDFIFPFLQKVTPQVFDKQQGKHLVASFVIDLTNGPQFALIIDNGTVILTKNIPSKIDCHISADPQAYFLVSSGIIRQWKPFLTGKIFVWGRKPWLILKIKSLFPNP
ncbi:MAG: DinB family protein [Patescibacteria group bacterium]